MAGKPKFPKDALHLERTRPRHPRAQAERVAAATMAETAAAQAGDGRGPALVAEMPAPTQSGARVFTLYGAPPRPPAPEPEQGAVDVDGSNVALDFYRRRQL